jgi:hypothetical protein
MIRILIFIFSFLFSHSFAGTKNIPVRKASYGEQSKTYIVYINYADYSVHASVLSDASKIQPKIGYTYYWYTDNDIKQTDGGYDGKLLHGEYKSFYLNKNLKEQGMFSHGLKEGIWKTWFPNGRIHEIIHYNKSRQHGFYELYDEEGNLISKSNFKNGMQNGKKVDYKNGKVDTIVVYKNGKIVSPKPAKHIKQLKTKKKSTVKNDLDNSKKPQDTVAKTPKSRFDVKKIFNKRQKEVDKRKTKKKTHSKEKDTPAHQVKPKTS